MYKYSISLLIRYLSVSCIFCTVILRITIFALILALITTLFVWFYNQIVFKYFNRTKYFHIFRIFPKPETFFKYFLKHLNISNIWPALLADEVISDIVSFSRRLSLHVSRTPARRWPKRSQWYLECWGNFCAHDIRTAIKSSRQRYSANIEYFAVQNLHQRKPFK